MEVNVLMPKLGLTMEEGTVVAWHAKEGQTISKGQVIAEIETEKIVTEIEAAEDGTLQKILVQVGQICPVAETIAVMDT